MTLKRVQQMTKTKYCPDCQTILRDIGTDLVCDNAKLSPNSIMEYCDYIASVSEKSPLNAEQLARVKLHDQKKVIDKLESYLAREQIKLTELRKAWAVESLTKQPEA